MSLKPPDISHFNGTNQPSSVFASLVWMKSPLDSLLVGWLLILLMNPIDFPLLMNPQWVLIPIDFPEKKQASKPASSLDGTHLLPRAVKKIAL
jgi:hypothetical protein